MNAPALIEWGQAGLPLPGNAESGDRCLVQVENGFATFAVIDGLGHGRDAALASGAVIEVLEEHGDEAIFQLFRRCHTRLQSTRGAAMALARYEPAPHRIQWIGAGSVRGILLRGKAGGGTRQQQMLIYSGTVGVKLPTLEVSVSPAEPGDTLFLATDGVGGDFAGSLRYGEPPQAQADRLFASYRNHTDDALILVARVAR